MERRPNLLLFMPETLRADAFFGPEETRARTPSFDRFCGQSAVFTQAYAQMAYCTPSRCSMFTGLYPHTGNHRSIWHLLQRGERHLFQDLKEAGYRNVVFGKNDLIDDSWAAECFDEYTPRHAPRRGGFERAPAGSDLEKLMYAGKRTGEWFDSDDACVQSACDFLEEDHEGPWCMFLPLNFAHPAYGVEEPWFSMHDRSRIPEPIPAIVENKRAYAQVLRDFHGGAEVPPDALREVKAVYFGMVSRIDQQFGVLLDKLDRRGLSDSTVVAFLSDHGDYAGDYGLVEKYMGGFEDCMLRVPLAFRAPGVPSGTHRALCEMADLYATLMDLVGLEPKHDQFGRSLMPVLSGERGVHREVVYAEGGRNPEEAHLILQGLEERQDYYGERVRFQAKRPELADRAVMARSQSYKYVYSAVYPEALYDLQEDPFELQNVAADPSYSEVLEEFRQWCLKWLVETSDTTPFEQTRRSWPRRVSG